MDRKTPDVGTDPIGLLARTAPHAPEYPESEHTVCQNTGFAAGRRTGDLGKRKSFIYSTGYAGRVKASLPGSLR